MLDSVLFILNFWTIYWNMSYFSKNKFVSKKKKNQE